MLRICSGITKEGVMLLRMLAKIPVPRENNLEKKKYFLLNDKGKEGEMRIRQMHNANSVHLEPLLFSIIQSQSH